MAKSILSLNKSELQSLLQEVFGDQAPLLGSIPKPLDYLKNMSLGWTQTGTEGRKDELNIHLKLDGTEGLLYVIRDTGVAMYAKVHVYLIDDKYRIGYADGGLQPHDVDILKCINDYIATWSEDDGDIITRNLARWLRTKRREATSSKQNESTWRKQVKALFEFELASSSSCGKFKIMLSDGKLVLYTEQDFNKWCDIHRVAFGDDDDYYLECLKEVGAYPETESLSKQYIWCVKLANLCLIERGRIWLY